ncbi:karyopherin beta [Irineochytrium annulatum]|nr:karyopherin beta [Irineochytrium annulatum]
MGVMMHELASEGQNKDVRQASGIQFKNAILARDPGHREEYVQRWMQLDLNLKVQLKEALMQTLASPESRAGSTAAQCVAAIGEIELPLKMWPDLIERLSKNALQTGHDALKQSSLEAIGYICEKIDPAVLQEQANLILNAVANGARKEEENPIVRLKAIKALINSLSFVKANFEDESERNYIMQIVCEATQGSGSEELQVAAYECLVHIMHEYYDKMPLYMDQALYGLTLAGMRSDIEQVVLQSIEFWSTVCEVEFTIKQEIQAATQAGDQPDVVLHYFAEKMADKLTNALLFMLTKKEEDDAEDEWNTPMAAATCLSLLATVIEDKILIHVIPWVEKHISEGDWHYREAAVMAFGSILDGPRAENLDPLIETALPLLINMMRDPQVQVKDTTAWALGRISELLSSSIQQEKLDPLVAAILNGLQDAPRVAANCAWCIINLAERIPEAETDTPTYKLSRYFDLMIFNLLQSAEQKLQHDSNLRATAYEAIATLVSTCAQDCFGTVERLAGEVMVKLEQTIEKQTQIVNNDDRMALQEQQGNLCSVLTNIIRRMSNQISASPLPDRIMMTLLTILQSAARSSTVHEDAFIVISSLTSAVGPDFMRYMKDFQPFLIAALHNPVDYQLTAIAVGLIGDICRAIEHAVVPLVPEYMGLLIENLKSPALERNVKPAILSCFGDIAIALSKDFIQYLDVVLAILVEAMGWAVFAGEPTFEQIDYANILREGILEAYVGIVQGLTAAKEINRLVDSGQIPQIFEFLDKVFNDPEHADSLATIMLGLIGDLADSLPGKQFKQQFGASWIEMLIKEVKSLPPNQDKNNELAKWAKSKIKRQIGIALV